MKAKRIWIAQHPDEPENRDIKFHEPCDDGEYLCSQMADGRNLYVKYKEYLLIELEYEG